MRAHGCHHAVGGLCLRCLFWRHFLEILLVRQKPQRGRTAARSCLAGSWITARQEIKSSQEPSACSSVLFAQRAITAPPAASPSSQAASGSRAAGWWVSRWGILPAAGPWEGKRASQSFGSSETCVCVTSRPQPNLIQVGGQADR